MKAPAEPTPSRPSLAREFPVPVGANLAVSGIVLVGMLATLRWLCHATTPWAFGASLALFCFLGQSLFAVIHEAEHDKLLPDKRWNDRLGVLLGALFPGSFSILRAGHLVHHGRNRTDAELIDFYRDGEPRLAKTVKYYAMMMGAIWAGVPVLTVVCCVFPGRYFRLVEGHEKGTDITTYLAFLSEVRPARVRLEALFVIAFWIVAAIGLDLDWTAALAYGTFGLVWSSQQYIYHVRTPLHVVEGSWDLHMWRPFELALLGTNYHLTHHRHPRVPWSHLPALAEGPPRRGYLATWVRLFLPPRHIRHAWPDRLWSGALPTPVPEEYASRG